MTDNVKKNLLFFTAWLLSVGLVLVMHFSFIALGVLALLAGLTLYAKVLSKSGKATRFLTWNIRYYIQISALFFLVVYAIDRWDGFHRTTGAAPRELEISFSTLGENLSELSAGSIVLILLLAGAALVLLAARKKLSNFTVLSGILNYHLPTFLFSLLFMGFLKNWEFLLVYVLCALVFSVGDLFRMIHGADDLKKARVGTWCFTGMSFLFLLLAVMNRDVRIELLTFRLHDLRGMFGSWGSLLYLFAVWTALTVVLFFLDPDRKNYFAYEKHVLLSIVSFFPVVFTFAKMYSGLDWIILTLYFLFVLLTLAVKAPKDAIDRRSLSVGYLLTMPLVSVGTVFLLLEAHFGKALLAAVLFGSTAILVALLRMLHKKEDEKVEEDEKAEDGEKKAKRVPERTRTLLLLVFLYVNTLTRLLQFHRSGRMILLFSILSAVFFAAVCVINYNPGIYQKNSFLLKGQALVPVCLLVTALVCFACGGSDISIGSEDGKITVETEADGKENAIVSAKYGWIDDLSGAAKDFAGSEETVYESFDGTLELVERRGLLKVVVEDKYGVVTEEKRWFEGPEIPKPPYTEDPTGTEEDEPSEPALPSEIDTPSEPAVPSDVAVPSGIVEES